MGFWINNALAVLTLVFGGFGFLAPRYTAAALDLAPTASTMGLGELRASAGGVWIALALGALISQSALVFAILGIAYLGASAGRVLSLMVDKPPLLRCLVFLGFEIGPALGLLALNGRSLF